MKPSELRESVHKNVIKNLKIILIGWAISMIIILCVGTASDWQHKNYPEYKWITVVVSIGLLLMSIYPITKICKKIGSNRTLCPKCKKPISPGEAPIIIATGNCTSCGQQIIEKIV